MLDLDNGFVDRCNHELIDIRRVVAEHMDAHRNFLQDMIRGYVAETGSDWGQELLNNFRDYVAKFWLVKPKATDLRDMLNTLRSAA